MAVVRAALDSAPIDAIATAAKHRRKRLLVADMDSTIVTGETLDELADFAGLKERIAAITARAMNGELDFKAALRERVAMLRGLPVGALESTWQRVHLTAGARELVGDDARRGQLHGAGVRRLQLLHRRGSPRRAASTCTAPTCCWTTARHSPDGVAEPILDRDTKLHTLTSLAVEHGLDHGDDTRRRRRRQRPGHAARAGLGVAFYAKPIVAAAAQARVDYADLRALLFVQGYRSEEILGAP